MPWDQLAVWLIGLAALAYLTWSAVGKRKKPGCGGCGTCESTPEAPAKATSSNLVQIETNRPARRPSAPPRPTDPSLN